MSTSLPAIANFDLSTPQGRRSFKIFMDNWKKLIDTSFASTEPSSVQYAQVANIASPTELAGYSGSVHGNILIAYDTTNYTIYSWDFLNTPSVPYVMTGDGGYWVAIGGRYSYATQRISTLTALRFVGSDADKGLVSLLLTEKLQGTAGRVTVTADGSGGATVDVVESGLDHGALGGLTGDDHTHYLLASGARSLSGNWNAGGYQVTNFTATLKAGTATAGTAPAKLTSGVSLTNPEAGALEFTTDDLYFTITTGPARKGIVLNDGTNLTSGHVPYVTTNGRLSSQAPVADGTYTVGDRITPTTGNLGQITITNGIITAIQQAS